MIKAATLGALCAYAAVGGNPGHRPRRPRGRGRLRCRVCGGGHTRRPSSNAGAPAGHRDGSDLVRAEAAEWLGDTLLSVGVLIGFLVAYGLVVAGRADLAAYVDPSMVTLVSLAFLWVPIKLIISGLREILSMAPEPNVLDQLRACIAAVEERYAFSESFPAGIEGGKPNGHRN